MTRVAVIGGGAAGIGAAHRLLGAGVDVLLLERGSRLGGNCFGVDVPLGKGALLRIDAGVSDFNEGTFLAFSRFLEDLGVARFPIVQDASFMRPDRSLVWRAARGKMEFRDTPDADALIAEIVRFRRTAADALLDPRFARAPASEYLDDQGYSAEFRRLYFSPRAGGAFPMPNCHPSAYPIRSLAAFWKIHGLIGDGPARRMCVEGGMHRYCDRFQEWFLEAGGMLHCSTRVVGVARRRRSIEVRVVVGRDEHAVHRVDQVVFAINPIEVKGVLEEPLEDEARLLPAFGWQRARICVHRDERLMPADRDTWGSYNFVVPEDGIPEVRPTITFWSNLLAQLPGHVPDVFVSVNPFVEPDPEKVIAERFFVHPVAGADARGLASNLGTIQGADRVFYAWSHLIEPFVHEQALVSGQMAADALIARASAGRGRSRRPSRPA